MWEIISIGRSDFLVSVLNALAILTADDGPAGYGGLVALGLLVGVVLTMMRAVVTQRLELQWVLAGWLLFAGLFVPKVSVVVEDIYTGETTVVANVPLGPAAIGSLTSTVGVTLADAFGAVFAVPSMTSTGYMDSLRIIDAMRTMDYGGANDGDAENSVAGVDLQKSMRGYFIDCVYYAMDMELPAPAMSAARLREAPNLVDAIEVDSNTWFTTVYLVAGDLDGQLLTCTEAYQQLSAFMQGRFLNAWESYIGSLMGLTDTSTQMQDALDAIFGVGRNAQTYMLNALIKRELELAEVGYHGSRPESVVMRVQAMEQRRVQWASEQSLWAEMARPAIAFIEGLFYALSPVVGFLFTLGAAGVTIFARYLLLAVWIQLWLPVLAVTNLYITIAASNDLRRISDGGTDLLTITGLDSVWTETASWLAFGGSMVAATPLLSLILITGSYFALTRLTDRLAGGDHVDERVRSPDIMAPAAIAATGAMGMQTAAYTSDPMHGLHRTGLPGVLPSVNFGSDIRSSVQSSRAAQQQAARDWSVSLSSGLDLSSQEGRERFDSNLYSTGFSGSFSQTDQFVQRMVQSAIDASGVSRSWSQDERNELSTAIGAGLQAQGAKRPPPGQREALGARGRAAIDAALSNIRSINDSQRKELGDRIEQMVGANSDEMAQLSSKVQQDASTGISSRFFQSMHVEDATRWAKAQRDSQSATEAYERASALSQNSGLRQDIKIQAIGHQATTEGWAGELLRLVSSNGLDMSKVEDNAGYWSRTGAMDHNTALASAAALALADGPRETRLDLAEMLSRHGFGTGGIALDDPVRNEPLEQHITSEVGVSDQSYQEFLEKKSALSGHVESQLGSAADLEARGRKAVESFFIEKKEGRPEKVKAALLELDRVVSAQRAAHAESTFEATRGVLQTIQDYDLNGQIMDFDVNAAGLRGAGEAYQRAYAEAISAGDNRAEAALAGLSAALRGYGAGFNSAVEGRRERAAEEARTLGLPDAAAQYYAYQHMLIQESMDQAVLRMVGKNEEYERLKTEATEQLGEKGIVMLNRAATAEPVARKFNLEGAVAIYKARTSEQEVEGPSAR